MGLDLQHFLRSNYGNQISLDKIAQGVDAFRREFGIVGISLSTLQKQAENGFKSGEIKPAQNSLIVPASDEIITVSGIGGQSSRSSAPYNVYSLQNSNSMGFQVIY